MLSFIIGESSFKPRKLCVNQHLKMFTTGTSLSVATLYIPMYVVAALSCVSTMLHPDTCANTSPTHLSLPLTLSLPPCRTPSRNQSPNNPCFLYDSPRPVAYDVPRASIRSRGGSFASSNDTLHTAVNNEVKNPMYITKQG